MDLSLMVAVPHRSYNRRYFMNENRMHMSMACCQGLHKLSVNERTNGKTLLFVPYFFLFKEGVSMGQYENWLNCMHHLGVRWRHSTLDRWESLSSWNTEGMDGEDVRTIRNGVRAKSENISIKYFEYSESLWRNTNHWTGLNQVIWNNHSPSNKTYHASLKWNEPGYIVETNYRGGSLNGEYHRLSVVNQIARFPFFKGSDWQDKGWFMTLWHDHLFNNPRLDDWAKISLSFLLMKHIDLSVENGYFLPFGKSGYDMFPNTFKNFMNVGPDYNSSLGNVYIKQSKPWGEYRDYGDVYINLKKKDLWRALLGDDDYMPEFLHKIKRAAFLQSMREQYDRYTCVKEVAFNTLIDFIETHTTLNTEYDSELDIRY